MKVQKLMLCVLLLGCRAQTGNSEDLAMDDMGGYVPDLSEQDLVGADLACSQTGPEICGNGCDDDRNGLADDEDPMCSAQLLAPQRVGTMFRVGRLVLEGTTRWSELATNEFNGDGAGVVVRSITPAFFYASEALRRVYRAELVPGGGTGAVTSWLEPFNWTMGGNARDVCFFGSELVVVERRPAPNISRLHRVALDLMSEKPISNLPVSGPATSCASDGTLLWVAIHNGIGGASRFYAFDSSLAQQGSAVDIPPTLAADGYDRVLDFARAKKGGGFYGLFVRSMGEPRDDILNATQVHPFGFDGGVGAPIDAGTLHGLGELDF